MPHPTRLPSLGSSRVLCVSLLFCLSLIGRNVAYGQAQATGIPPFGTFNRDSIDTINVANLNVHFEFPLFTKKGRGLDFYASVVHDNSELEPVYTQGVGYSFKLIPAAIEWKLKTPYVAGAMQYTQSGAICNYQGSQYNAVVESNFAVADHDNTVHSFNTIQVGSTPCYNHTMTGTSPDGYLLSVSVDPNYGQIASWSLSVIPL